MINIVLIIIYIYSWKYRLVPYNHPESHLKYWFASRFTETKYQLLNLENFLRKYTTMSLQRWAKSANTLLLINYQNFLLHTHCAEPRVYRYLTLDDFVRLIPKHNYLGITLEKIATVEKKGFTGVSEFKINFWPISFDNGEGNMPCGQATVWSRAKNS